MDACSTQKHQKGWGWGCLGQGAEDPKSGARSLALVTALSLGGKVFGHERNSQYVASAYSSESVDVKRWCWSKGNTLPPIEQGHKSEGLWLWTGGLWHIHPGHAGPLSGCTTLTPNRIAGKDSPYERAILDWGDSKRHRELWRFSLLLISRSAWGKAKEINIQMIQQSCKALHLLSELLKVRPKNHKLKVLSQDPFLWNERLSPALLFRKNGQKRKAGSSLR